MNMFKRIKKEIDTGLKSTEFDFMCDETGAHGDPSSCYLKFVVKTGSYMGQIHILKINFIYGDNGKHVFPASPPYIKFMTPIFHANISDSGSICLDVIKPGTWSPMYSIETIFISILALLDNPNTSSPLNGVASRIYSENNANETPDVFKKICSEYYFKNIRNEEINKLLHSTYFRNNS